MTTEVRTDELHMSVRPTGSPRPARPRLGFLGVGWIGRHRMEAIAADAHAEIVALADSAAGAASRALEVAPNAQAVATLDDLLALELDGIVIATPSAQHAAQAQAALESGLAVFCQKPLARTAAETRRIIETARAADRLLGVDLSYRHTAGMRCICELVHEAALGRIYAIDLVFHNAHGPDKAWFRDPALSGGGCVIDLGIHLIDLALWMLDYPAVQGVTSSLYAGGQRLAKNPAVVEDFAVAELQLDTGAVARITCSWNLSAGCDAVIEAMFHGTRGGATMRNVNGSFYDFVAERFEGTRRSRLVDPPDAWGGRAAVAWARQLAADGRFDPDIEHVGEVAAVIDRIYGR